MPYQEFLRHTEPLLTTPRYFQNATDNMGYQAYIPPDFDATGGPSTDNNAASAASGPSGPSEPPKYSPPRSDNMWNIGYYRAYFDIDTADFLQRCLKSLRFYSNESFNDIVNGNPDLYGPVWITWTVTVVLFFANSVFGLIQTKIHGETYEYNFALLNGAAGLLFGYTFLTPLLLYLSGKYLKITSIPTITYLISLYGYSNLIWIPVAVLNISPLFSLPVLMNILRWVFVILGFLFSGIFIAKNLYMDLKAGTEELPNGKKLLAGVIGVLAMAHAGFAIAVKVTFFG